MERTKFRLGKIAAWGIVAASMVMCGASLQAQDRPDPGRPPGPPGMQRGMQQAIDNLNLTDEQHKFIDPIVQDYRQKQQQAREEFFKQMKGALTPEQYESFESSMRRPPAPPPQGNRPPENSPGNQPSSPPPAASAGAALTTAPQTAAAAIPPAPEGSTRVAVVFTGGYETDPRDHGRPVVLIAAALKVTSDVFRDAFSHVTPASGGREPEEPQVRLNKQALMHALGPYGVTDDRLNAVSNYYRYSGFRGQMWRNTPAAGYATLREGVVTDITLTNPGAGYSSAPTVSIPGPVHLDAAVTLSFGTDFATNGSIKEITLKKN